MEKGEQSMKTMEIFPKEYICKICGGYTGLPSHIIITSQISCNCDKKAINKFGFKCDLCNVIIKLDEEDITIIHKDCLYKLQKSLQVAEDTLTGLSLSYAGIECNCYEIAQEGLNKIKELKHE